jgi:hypothetical protein
VHQRPEHGQRSEAQCAEHEHDADADAGEQNREPACGGHEQRRAEIGLVADQDRRRQDDEPHDHELRNVGGRRRSCMNHAHIIGTASFRSSDGWNVTTPNRATLRALADLAFDGDDEQQADTEEIQPRREDAQVVRRDLRDDEERAEAHAEPHGLTEQQAAVLRDGAVEHDHAEPDDREQDQEQGHVDDEAPEPPLAAAGGRPAPLKAR